jgi:transcription elongation GreA/GreB family factor
MSLSVDKATLVKQIVAQLEKDLALAIEAAVATYEAATHEESKPENEYDTRGLEASYLAGAQSKRAGEIEELLAICKQINARPFGPDDRIQTTALVEVELNGQDKLLFVLPKGGGMTLSVSGRNVQVITPLSPIGNAIMGLSEGDVAQVEVAGQLRDCEILSVR